MEFINQIDHQLFLALNHYHTEWLDGFMLLVTHKYTWLPLYAFLVGLIIYRYKMKSWLVILSIIAFIAISDRFTSGVMKPYFQRLRPCHEVVLQEKMTLVGNCGGEYGMASSHAANTFAVASFLVLLWWKDKKWIWLLLPWSILVSYSRIYLGVHFPGDVLAGILVGFLAQLGFYFLIKNRISV